MTGLLSEWEIHWDITTCGIILLLLAKQFYKDGEDLCTKDDRRNAHEIFGKWLLGRGIKNFKLLISIGTSPHVHVYTVSPGKNTQE